jgi:glycosyltransferase involved in cell wall biosynthesis
MPVLDAEPYLDASVRSILRQSWRDLELVALENGSRDGSRETLREWARRDARIRLLEHDAPLGMPGSSNHVVAAARAPLVARMDADDVSHPRRIECQVAALERHSDAVAVGTLYDGIDSSGRAVRPRDRSLLRRRTTEAPFPHGSVMVRRAAFDAVGGYRDDADGWEDLDLLQRLAEIGRVLVLPEALYRVRFHTRSGSVRVAPDRLRKAVDAKRRTVGTRYPTGRSRSFHEDDSIAGRLYLREAMRLWAGERPALRQALSEMQVRPKPGRRLAFAAWGTWGRVSPASLRGALRAWIRLRDLRAARHVRDGRVVEWRWR